MESNPTPIVINPDPSIPVLANIPHASSFVPAKYRDQIILSAAELAAEHASIVDWFTDELYEPIVQRGGSALIAPVSRLVLDTERYDDDEKEVMAQRGVGVIYERTTDCKLLRRGLDVHTRQEMIRDLYKPYHQLMENQVSSIIAKFGHCVLLDCHSYPQHALPYELHPEGARPQICFGADQHHSPAALIDSLRALCEKRGWTVDVNTPFAGTMVPLRYYRDPRLTSVMLEVRRDLYMSEVLTEKLSTFTEVQEWVDEVVGLCLDINTNSEGR